MNARQHFLSLMRGEKVRPLYWEFAYWSAAVERWYNEGLNRSPYSPPLGFPAGSGVIAESLPFPLQPYMIRYRDIDVHKTLGFDEGCVRIPINWRMCPNFQESVIAEEETTLVLIDKLGVKVRVKKASDSLPQYLDWPVKDRASWEKIKEERFNANNILDRFPARFKEIAPSFKNRDYPLGVVLDGFFSLPRELMGVENQLMMYYLDAELMHDIGKQIAKVWLTILEELFNSTDIDFVYFWEDMAFKNGPMLSPEFFRQFITPHYKQITDFVKSKGVDIIFVDTDGDCWKLIPEFINAGVTGMYPFEVNCGMDIVEVRKQFPELMMFGGLDKMNIAQGKKAIDEELDYKLPFMLKYGRYVPHCDHLVPPEVSWDNYCYFREKIKYHCEKYF